MVSNQHTHATGPHRTCSFPGRSTLRCSQSKLRGHAASTLVQRCAPVQKPANTRSLEINPLPSLRQKPCSQLSTFIGAEHGSPAAVPMPAAVCTKTPATSPLSYSKTSSNAWSTTDVQCSCFDRRVGSLEQRDTWAGKLLPERCYLVVWTNRTLLTLAMLTSE